MPSAARTGTPAATTRPTATVPAPEPYAGQSVPREEPARRGFLARLADAFRVPEGWEPPGAESTTLDCYACGHEWDSAAAPGNTVRCPMCRHPRRVPSGTAPAPSSPAALVRNTRPTVPAVPRTAPAPPPPAPRPLVSPAETYRDEQRMHSVGAAFRSLGGPWLVYYKTPVGTCEAMNANELPEYQRCPARATHAVVLWHDMYGQTHARACHPHAEAMAKHVRRFQGFRADTQRLIRRVV